MKLPWIVSIAFNFHDSSVALAHGNEILTVLEAERIFRIKKLRCDCTQMNILISILLKDAGINFNDVDIWCGTAFGNEFISNKYPEVREVEWLKADIMENEISLRCVNHHRAHAAFFHVSPFKDAVVISCDGGGDSECHEIFYGNNLTLIRKPPTENVKRFSSIFYDRASFYLYRKYRQEGKFMGLSAWEEPDHNIQELLMEKIDDISNSPEEDGLNIFEKIYPHLSPDFSDKRVRVFAASVQKTFEEARLDSARDYNTLSKNLVLVGGSALNITANTRLLIEAGYENVWVPPNCDDTGQALGALIDTIVSELGTPPEIQFPFLGRRDDDFTHNPDVGGYIDKAVDHLIKGNVLAWHDGRSEVGPRALGHRSLLAAPFSNKMRVLVSELIKQRENYRPVAPIVLEEEADNWFDLTNKRYSSPYMSFSYKANPNCRRLSPAIVHVDGSARAQTLSTTNDSSLIVELLLKFKEKTGIPILINTSLNSPDSPICENKEDTIRFIEKIKEKKSREKVILFFKGKHKEEQS